MESGWIVGVGGEDGGDDIRGGAAFDEGKYGHFTAVPADDLRFGEIFGTVVATLRVDVRPDRFDESVGTGFIENAYVIHAPKVGEHFGPFGLRNQGALWALETSNGRIAVNADNEEVAERTGLGQVARVPNVKNVEASVGEDDALSLFAMDIQGGRKAAAIEEL